MCRRPYANICPENASKTLRVWLQRSRLPLSKIVLFIRAWAHCAAIAPFHLYHRELRMSRIALTIGPRRGPAIVHEGNSHVSYYHWGSFVVRTFLRFTELFPSLRDFLFSILAVDHRVTNREQFLRKDIESRVGWLFRLAFVPEKISILHFIYNINYFLIPLSF